MRKLLHLIFVLGLLAGMTVVTGGTVVQAGHAGTTIFVDGDCDPPETGSSDDPFCTIQDAIDHALPGDTIRVRRGMYAGAVVDKAVHLEAQGNKVIINTGPESHPGAFRAGFLFNEDRSGRGASIEGFHFSGTEQYTGAPDDGELDFAIFSRGADDVEIEDNSIENVLQGITHWNGSGWSIKGNSITDLWTRNGGGVGILIGGNDGVTPIVENEISKNDIKGTIQVDPADGGGYDGTGIVVYADFRFGRDGAPTISENRVDKNKVELISNTPDVVNANGIELTVAYDTVPSPVPPTITDNRIEKNKAQRLSGNGISVSAGSADNSFDKNQFRHNSETDAVDESSGSGTDGTANTWTNNKCDTSSPVGLCENGSDEDEDSGTVVISGNTAANENDKGGWFFARDQANATPYEFNSDAASIGQGSLFVQPIGSTPARKFIGEHFLQESIADVGSITYDFRIASGGDAGDANQFYLNVYANFGELAPLNFYDCRYDIVPTMGSTSEFTTVTFDPTQPYLVTTRGTSPYPCPAIPAEMDALSPGSTIRVFSLNVGDTSANDESLDGYLDNVVVTLDGTSTTFDFEPADDDD